MIYYRVTLDVPFQLVIKVQQAVFILAWFRGKPGLRRHGEDFRISQATAYRYEDEGVAVLAALARTLKEAPGKAAGQGLPCLILDGTLISPGHCPDKKNSRKGAEIDKWHPRKVHEHTGNVQALTAPSVIPRSLPASGLP